ncbi:hypothetical protein H1P_3050001 [Hyella patelloides LEGE 07179]|uniref:DNA helicase DnaB-like N-terminal domain-containing protein n=1 Tax=Hyella patelloides LEGE 07179 TaxID=945734 RepID=A0A563VUB4_9CYAN|nr:DnaB-like helicase N-terminal domain-containing protein [Hyella patelloides]VEP15066.1 hypothetical protein H1P_3050001 [Hyella patelloides LEGE 07179]
MNDNKLPPANIEAEEAILGGILLDPGAMSRIETQLHPQAFFFIGTPRNLSSCSQTSSSR